MKKKRYFSRTVIVLLAILFAFLFVMPTLLTITNSFMTQSEITANYGQVFDNAKDGKSYISKTINLKFIPDKVSFSQYWTVLLKSPDYIYKLWNSIILTVPIVFAQLMVASIAAYGFTRWRGKVRDSIFFFYVIPIRSRSCRTIWCPTGSASCTPSGPSCCPARSRRSQYFCSRSSCGVSRCR